MALYEQVSEPAAMGLPLQPLLGIALREETNFVVRVVRLLSISIILCCCLIQMPLLNANLLH